MVSCEPISRCWMTRHFECSIRWPNIEIGARRNSPDTSVTIGSAAPQRMVPDEEAADPIVTEVSGEFLLAPISIFGHRIEHSKWRVIQHRLIGSHETIKQPVFKATPQLAATLRAPFFGPPPVCYRSLAHVSNLPCRKI